MDCFSFSHPGWKPLDRSTFDLARLGPIDERLPIDDAVTARVLPMPIYPGWHLLCLQSAVWGPALKVCFLCQGDESVRLNGKSAPIHDLNGRVPLLLDERTVLFYVTFFCALVHGDEGAFYVLHDLDDPMLPEGFAQARPKGHDDAPDVRYLFRRPRLFGRDDRGRWRASALVHYANALFLGDFLVREQGLIEMSSDLTLAADLPCRMAFVLEPPRA